MDFRKSSKHMIFIDVQGHLRTLLTSWIKYSVENIIAKIVHCINLYYCGNTTCYMDHAFT